MRYVAVDLGDQRTGLAIADSSLRIVSPLEVVEVPIAREEGAALLHALADAIARAVPASAPCELVVGLPFNMDGTEGPRAKTVRAFAARLGERTGRVLHFHDERLSTAAADWQMARTGLTRGEKKSRRDKIAAAVILTGFLESLDGGPQPLGEGDDADGV